MCVCVNIYHSQRIYKKKNYLIGGNRKKKIDEIYDHTPITILIIMYKLHEIESKQYEIHILTYPFLKRRGRKIYRDGKGGGEGGNKEIATKECISILVDVYGINEKYITEERGNIFCPFHENKHSSNSPSARFRVSKHSYSCYSSQCPLKRVVPISSTELLNSLKKKVRERIL